MTRNVAMFLLAAFRLWTPDASAQSATPWLHLAVGAARDRQPQTALEAAAELGRYLSPNATLSATMELGHVAGRSAATRTATPGARLTWSLPRLGTGVDIRAGVLLGAPHSSAAAAVDAQMRVGAGRGVTLRAGAALDRYMRTIASLDTLLMYTRTEAAVDRAASTRWAFELAARQERFGDGNPVSTAFGWLLAPLSASATHRVRGGYALAWQDSEQSRWVADDARRGRGGTTPDTIPGRYDPYYSPHDVVVHSVLLEGVIAIGPTWLTVKTSVGVRATETAPVLQRPSPPPASLALVFYERTFQPSQSSASLHVPLGTAASMRVEAWHDRTAFYHVTGARVAFTRALGGE